VVGVDSHRDQRTLAIVAAPTGAVVAQTTVGTDARGYREALRFVGRHAAGARVWAVEGAGHDGAALTCYLNQHSETVLEVGGSLRSERRLGGKNDPLDAIRAARSALASETLTCREPANVERRCGCCCLRAGAPSTSVGSRSCSYAA
jgi:transposase